LVFPSWGQPLYQSTSFIVLVPSLSVLASVAFSHSDSLEKWPPASCCSKRADKADVSTHICIGTEVIFPSSCILFFFSPYPLEGHITCHPRPMHVMSCIFTFQPNPTSSLTLPLAPCHRLQPLLKRFNTHVLNDTPASVLHPSNFPFYWLWKLPELALLFPRI